MWNLIGETIGLVRETIKRRFKTRHERVWKEKAEEIDNAVAKGDVNRISAMFKRLRKQGSASDRK